MAKKLKIANPELIVVAIVTAKKFVALPVCSTPLSFRFFVLMLSKYYHAIIILSMSARFVLYKKADDQSAESTCAISLLSMVQSHSSGP